MLVLLVLFVDYDCGTNETEQCHYYDCCDEDCWVFVDDGELACNVDWCKCDDVDLHEEDCEGDEDFHHEPSIVLVVEHCFLLSVVVGVFATCVFFAQVVCVNWHGR